MRYVRAYACAHSVHMHSMANQSYTARHISDFSHIHSREKQLLMAQFVQFFQMDPNKLEGGCKLCKEKSGKQVFVKYTSSSKSNLKSHFNTHQKNVDIDLKAKAPGSGTINNTSILSLLPDKKKFQMLWSIW